MKNRSLLVAMLLVVPTTAWSYGLGPVTDAELAQVATKAANHLLGSQLNNGGWAWKSGDKKHGANFSGLVAEALLAAHEHTGRSDYRQAAESYGHSLTKKLAAEPTELPYKPDIEFLVRLTEVSGDVQWAHAASRWFAVLQKTSPQGAAEVQRIMDGRRSHSDLVGFDIALGIRAALAVEEYDYAHQLADAVWVRRATWLRQPTKTFGTISRAALLDALVMLDRTKYRHQVATLARQLRDEQTDNGSWCTNETQATAYVVRALARLGEAQNIGAARRGSKWLSATSLSDGRWAHFNDGLPEPFVGDVINEVQAEALTAVILASHL